MNTPYKQYLDIATISRLAKRKEDRILSLNSINYDNLIYGMHHSRGLRPSGDGQTKSAGGFQLTTCTAHACKPKQHQQHVFQRGNKLL